MSDVIENQEENNEAPEISQEELLKFYTENKGLAAKKDELLGETKAAKKAREDALAKLKEYEERQAEQEEKQKQAMKESGEYKTLYEQLSKDLEKERQERKREAQERRDEKVEYQAMKIARELAKGHDESAELLSVFVKQSLSDLADDRGNLNEKVVEDVKHHFAETPKYAPLIGGTQATGGGARGSETIKTNKSFSEMTEAERVALHKKDPEKYRKMRDNA